MKGLSSIWNFILLTFAVVFADDGLVTCPESGQVFLAHPYNCSQFIVCNNGVYQVLNCASGLYFDSTLGYCNLADDVDCVLENSTEEENEESESVCPESGQVFYPHPSSCSDFIECNNGVSTVISCIPGLEFDPELGHCDFPENVNCTLEDADAEDDDIGDTNSGDDESDDEDGEGSSSDEDWDDGESGSGDDGSDDEESGSSDDGEWDDDSDGESGSGDADSDDEEGSGADDNVTEDDNSSTLTTTDIPIITTTEESTTELESGPVGECPPENGEDVDFLTDSADCSIYYMCNWGTPIQMQCPDQLYFNPALNVCDWPENVDCAASASTATEEITTTEQTLTTQAPTSTQQSTTLQPTTTEEPTTQQHTITEEPTTEAPTTTGEPTTQAAQEGPVGECPPDGSLVFLSDSADCSIYYMCSWGTPIKMQCGANLHFNPTLNICDWPQNAGCTV